MHLTNHFCTGFYTEAVFMAIQILGSGTQDLTSKGQSSAMTQKTSQLQSAAAPERHVEKMHCLDVVSLNMSNTNTSQSSTRSQGTSASDRKGKK